jgi:hypothetical protein
MPKIKGNFDSRRKRQGRMLLLSALSAIYTAPIQPRAHALINHACRADQPECKLHLRLLNHNTAVAQPARCQPLAPSSPDCRSDVTRSARPPTNSPSARTPRERQKTPIFQAPNTARAQLLCKFGLSAIAVNSAAIISAETPDLKAFFGHRPNFATAMRTPWGVP